MLALCQYNALAYYAFYYAGIFDAGLAATEYMSSKLHNWLSTATQGMICIALRNVKSYKLTAAGQKQHEE